MDPVTRQELESHRHCLRRLRRIERRRRRRRRGVAEMPRLAGHIVLQIVVSYHESTVVDVVGTCFQWTPT